MSATEKTISSLIGSQLPDFVKANHPQFQRFIELYYEWLEQNDSSGISNTAGNTVYQAAQIADYRDIDSTPDDFVRYFKQELLPYFPEKTALDIKKILKSAREFYSQKGSEESIKWLFKALFDEDIEINYPKEQILKTSDGKWKQPKAFRITVGETNKNIDVNLLEKRLVTGDSSGATCVIESANRTIDPTNGFEVIEIYISNIRRFFENGEFITVNYIDENGVDRVFSEKIIGTISNVRLDSNIRTDPRQRRRGLLYNIGDPVIFTGGLATTAEAADAIAIVGNVSLGSIESVATTFPGYGYRTYSITETIVLRSTNDDPNANLSTDLRVAAINIAACTANSQLNFLEPITYDKTVIDYLSDTVIGTANLAAFTVNNRNAILNVTEKDFGDNFENFEQIYANSVLNTITDALFTAKIASPNGNTQISGTVNVTTSSSTVIGNNTNFLFELKVGEKLEVDGERDIISSITNNDHLIVQTGYSFTSTDEPAYRIGNFSANGGSGSEFTGGLLVYDIKSSNGQLLSTSELSQILNSSIELYTSNTSKSFVLNSITEYFVPANANSLILQCVDLETVNTGGIALVEVKDGGFGFRSVPSLQITSHYDTHLSEQYDYEAGGSQRALKRAEWQTFRDLGQIAHVWINSGGSRYDVNDELFFSGRGYGGSGYVQSVSSNGAITSVVLTDRGEGHLTRPTVNVRRLSPLYNVVSGTATIVTGNNLIVGSGTQFTLQFNTTNIIRVNNEIRRVSSVINNTHLLVNTAFNTTGTSNTIERQFGSEATLTAYLFGDGVENTIGTNAIGRIRNLRLIYRGFDYVDTPNVSLKVVDTVINPVPEDVSFTETEYIYQGPSLATSTFRANVKQYVRSTGLLRLYNYSGSINPLIDFETQNGVFANVNTSATVPAPAQYPPAVIATGLPNPMYYGDGRARANAIFANGLIQFDGFHLNTDGFPSSDKRLQDSRLYHNFSYIVQSEKPLIEFETPLRNIVHPAGMSVISKTILKSNLDAESVTSSNVHLIKSPTIGTNTPTVTIANSFLNVVTGNETNFEAPEAKANVGDLFIIIDTGNPLRSISRIISAVTNNTELEVFGDFIYPGQGKLSLLDGVVTANVSSNVNAISEFLQVGDQIRINVPNVVITGTVNVTGTSVDGNTTSPNTTYFLGNVVVGSEITVNNETRSVTAVIDDNTLTVNTAFVNNAEDKYLTANSILIKDVDGILGNTITLNTAIYNTNLTNIVYLVIPDYSSANYPFKIITLTS